MFGKLKFWGEKRSADTDTGLEILEGGDGGDVILMTDSGALISQEMNPEAFAVMLAGGGGRIMSRDTALSLSAVYSCVDRISSAIAMMPFEVKQITGETVTDVTQHDASFLLGHKPNQWQTPYLMKQLLMVDVLTDGNLYCEVRKTRKGGIDSFNWYDARGVGMYNTGPGRWVYDAVDDEGNNRIIYPEDMVHVRALRNKGRKGLSPIRLHAELINMGLDAEEYGQSFFSAGGKPSGIVGVKTSGGPINDKSMENLKTTWKRAANMADSFNKTIFLPADVTYTPMSISPVDAKLVEVLKLSRAEIGGIYNVPSYLIGDFDKAPNSNITQFSISFVRNTLQAWITALEDELNVKIFTRDELLRGMRIRLDMDVLTRGTPVERAQINHYAITDGWKNRNTVRVEEGYSRVEGQGMDDYLVSVNAVQQGANMDNKNGDDENNDDTKTNDPKGLQNGDNGLNPNGDDIQITE